MKTLPWRSKPRELWSCIVVTGSWWRFSLPLPLLIPHKSVYMPDTDVTVIKHEREGSGAARGKAVGLRERVMPIIIFMLEQQLVYVLSGEE